MACTEAYREHIMYSFNAFCKVVIRYAAINAWRDRNRRRQKEISFEYLTEEKFYPLSTSDEFLKSPYEQYPVTICGQTIILTNGELAAAPDQLPEGFVYKEFPEGEYIVCRIEAENFEDLVTVALNQADKYLFSTWLPRHGLTTEPFSAEKYDRSPEDMARMEIWVKPLSRKAE